MSDPSARRAVVVGGGLAGAEAAWQLAERGVRVTLYEKRPGQQTPAHHTGLLAELVCSNSLGADLPTSPAGILKEELRTLRSLVLRCAEESRVPAGKALAVDRAGFALRVTEAVSGHPQITLIREEATGFPDAPTILATGPLMRGEIAEHLRAAVGEDYFFFFDAAAPIVAIDSVDMGFAYRANRYGEGDDYVNCPLGREGYEAFWRALVDAERVPLHAVDVRGEGDAPVSKESGEGSRRKKQFFEGCLPVEVMAERGIDTLRFGPMRPIGLPDPRTGREPYALVQLRRDNAEGTLYNLVGFQTNLRWPEQERVFRMIPALAGAEFVRKGVMHRNAFVCAPRVLDAHLRPTREGVPVRGDLFLAGQITGVEGYVESVAMGLVAATNLHAHLSGNAMPEWPRETAIGSLLHYLRTAEPETFQPMNVNLGIFPPVEIPRLPGKRKKPTKQDRCLLYAQRSRAALESFLSGL